MTSPSDSVFDAVPRVTKEHSSWSGYDSSRVASSVRCHGEWMGAEKSAGVGMPERQSQTVPRKRGLDVRLGKHESGDCSSARVGAKACAITEKRPMRGEPSGYAFPRGW